MVLKYLLPFVLVLSSWDAAGRGNSYRDMLFRGSGVLTKFHSQNPQQQVTQDFAAIVIMGVSKDEKLQIGYKVVFSDESEKTLALELALDDSTEEVSAQVRSRLGDGQNEDNLSGLPGVVAETEKGYQILFKKEDESLLEVVIDIQNSPTNIGGDLIKDVHMTITTNDWSASGSSDPAVLNLQITSRLDFNSLMRNDDDSYELLLKELFGN